MLRKILLIAVALIAAEFANAQVAPEQIVVVGQRPLHGSFGGFMVMFGAKNKLPQADGGGLMGYNPSTREQEAERVGEAYGKGAYCIAKGNNQSVPIDKVLAQGFAFCDQQYGSNARLENACETGVQNGVADASNGGC